MTLKLESEIIEINVLESSEFTKIGLEAFEVLKMVKDKYDKNMEFEGLPGKESYKSQPGKIIAYRPIIRNFKQ